MHAAKEPELLCARWFWSPAELAPRAECGIAILAGLGLGSVDGAPDVRGCAVCELPVGLARENRPKPPSQLTYVLWDPRRAEL